MTRCYGVVPGLGTESTGNASERTSPGALARGSSMMRSTAGPTASACYLRPCRTFRRCQETHSNQG